MQNPQAFDATTEGGKKVQHVGLFFAGIQFLLVILLVSGLPATRKLVNIFRTLKFRNTNDPRNGFIMIYRWDLTSFFFRHPVAILQSYLLRCDVKIEPQEMLRDSNISSSPGWLDVFGVWDGGSTSWPLQSHQPDMIKKKEDQLNVVTPWNHRLY